MAAAQKNNEWNAWNEEQRNCLKWPDFLQWGDPRNEEIHRADKDSPLGLVTVAVQDLETKQWYNITKHIQENHPTHGQVKPYEWIVAVDNKPVSNEQESTSLRNLINNGENIVCLSLKGAADPLTKIAKEWVGEKDVVLNLKEKKVAFELAHFYSKEENGNINDRILVWHVKPTAETSEPLYKGDELLAVNDDPVKGKKLAEVFELIFRGQIPGQVNLKIKEIRRRGECNAKETEPDSIAVAPEVETPLNEPDPGAPRGNKRSEFDDSTQLIVVEKEMDENAGRKNEIQSEVYQNTSVVEEQSSEYPLPESEQTSKTVEDKNDLIKPQQEMKKRFPCRRRSRGSQSGSLSRQISNEGYNGTPETTRKFPTPDKMCRSCLSSDEKRLPDDRSEWAIDKIETSSFEEICKLLDLNKNSVSLLSALGCFKNKEAMGIKQKYSTAGGIGMSEFALGRWGTSNRRHNVGALKTIVENTMVRVDVIEMFEKWENMSVCHGCGVKL